MNRDKLVTELNTYLNASSYSDYGPNGLQIKGSDKIKKIAFAVSATRESINKAVEMKADTLIVHHGLFWKFHGPKTLTGAFYNRVAPLVKNDINLIGYHLPLDGHQEIGNAASIAKLLGLTELKAYGDYKGMSTGVSGKFTKDILPKELNERLSKELDHQIIHSSPNDEPIKSLAIITGGANSDWIGCVNEDIDAYLTGEISEHDWHEAKESDIHFFAGGHNATERPGIISLMNYIKETYKAENLELVFIDSENPA